MSEVIIKNIECFFNNTKNIVIEKLTLNGILSQADLDALTQDAINKSCRKER